VLSTIPCPTNPIRTSRSSTWMCRRCSIISALKPAKTGKGGPHMSRRTAYLLAGAAAVLIVAGFATLGTVHADEPSAGVYVTTIPPGYRDWKFISVAHEEGNLHSFAAVLGNDLAIKAYREGKFPFPDGAIIAALHYRHVPSEENNKVFGQAQSFVAGQA